MPVFVVDTNVAIVANGRNTHADMACQLSCVEEIESVRQYGIVALDEAGEIMEEYGKHLNFYGMPGVEIGRATFMEKIYIKVVAV